MSIEETDVVVIGMGPGGEDAAGRLAQAGLHVTGVEAKLVGGECPYWGCVPSKMMVRAASLLAEARRVPGLAGASTVNPDWEPVARRIREEATDSWDDKVAVDRVDRARGAWAGFLSWMGRRPGLLRATETACRRVGWVLYHLTQAFRERDPRAREHMAFLRRVKYPYEVFQD